MSRPKKSKAYPIVAVLTILIIALAVVCFLVNPLVIQPQRDALERANQEARAKVEEQNRQAEIEYQKARSDYENAKNQPTHPDWPEATVKEGFELIDLTDYPLDYQTGKQMSRSELMTGGMLLVNEWHERPADFDQSGVISVKQAYSGDDRIQAKDNLVTLFPNAVEALHEALMAAKAEGHLHYLVEEGYRTVEKQQEYFTNRINKLSSKYEGDALIAAAKKEVNEPGHSEYNTGLAFELRLFDKDDADVAVPKYSTTPQAKWLNENCWKYGIVFRFPQNAWPLETSTDKSFKTGVSKRLNLYRYVGKGNAAIMHFMDFTMEEYIEYLQEHPHIALFENGKVKYEVYRQIVGDLDPINVQITANASEFESSLDNMGGIITVFYYNQQ